MCFFSRWVGIGGWRKCPNIPYLLGHVGTEAFSHVSQLHHLGQETDLAPFPAAGNPLQAFCRLLGLSTSGLTPGGSVFCTYCFSPFPAVSCSGHGKGAFP